MKSYEKPNLILPVSLHDARLNNIEIENTIITFIMEDGIRTISGRDVEQTGKAKVTFPKVDFDFCKVYCTGKDNYRKEWNIDDFATKLYIKKPKPIIDIIDETYGYNQAKFSCNLTMNDEWFDCEIEIYHFEPMKYVWNE
ncbi:hypothetical protein HZF24_17435 [Sedimentibacter hydroxybenzoicus DSM 7310]|uniref:Uncharacterized protein n=1 Tax=Sedimentibacter hydroxybenzoicus DSM 7310 TaxID=1123245 RepID=A0A974BMF7_SEDHY|nr:hypothetical protein [Sedimentibacter hydroxybenzoicus]NYB75934.1 hypothetical protein [Sedimentibacter hydroxybenzoicus DSM 7310]